MSDSREPDPKPPVTRHVLEQPVEDDIDPDDDIELVDGEIELVDDGEGFAVIGAAAAVERFLRSQGLWDFSHKVDLQRLRALLGKGSDLLQAASEIAGESSRWLKLTPESARLRHEFGLTPTKTPGISHAMIGERGDIRSWLQVEGGAPSLLSNPAVLSGVAGIMAQAAMQQTMAEITEYLAGIDEKVDDVLRKQDDAVIAEMVGIGAAIERAMTVREDTGSVSADLWSTVDQAPQIVGATQSYALDQLGAVAQRLENPKVGALAKALDRARAEVPRWLAVLARCFQLEEAIDLLQLDRVLAETPDELDTHRRGLERHREKRRELIARCTTQLLDRMEEAVGTANAKLIWNRTKALEVIATANQVAGGLDDFHGLVGVESASRALEVRQLERAEDFGSRAIQRTKDDGPKAVMFAGFVVTVKVVQNKLGIDGSDDSDPTGD